MNCVIRFIFITFILYYSQKAIGASNKASQVGWRELLFPNIVKVAKEASLQPLIDKAASPEFNQEVRVWIASPDNLIYCYILGFSEKKWQAMYIKSNSKSSRLLKIYSVKLGSHADSLWKDLIKQGILELPDASSLKYEVVSFDGPCVIIEAATRGNKYRIYHYFCPGDQKWPEARRVEKIISLLRDTFAIQPE